MTIRFAVVFIILFTIIYGLYYSLPTGSVIGQVKFRDWNLIKQVHSEKSLYVKYDPGTENVTLLKKIDADKNSNKITLRLFCEDRSAQTRNVSNINQVFTFYNTSYQILVRFFFHSSLHVLLILVIFSCHLCWYFFYRSTLEFV